MSCSSSGSSGFPTVLRLPANKNVGVSPRFSSWIDWSTCNQTTPTEPDIPLGGHNNPVSGGGKRVGRGCCHAIDQRNDWLLFRYGSNDVRSFEGADGLAPGE